MRFSNVIGNLIVNVIPACGKVGEAEGVLLRSRSQHSQAYQMQPYRKRQAVKALLQSWPLSLPRSKDSQESSRLLTNDILESLVMQFLAPFSSFWHPLKMFTRGPRPPANTPLVHSIPCEKTIYRILQENYRILQENYRILQYKIHVYIYIYILH